MLTAEDPSSSCESSSAAHSLSFSHRKREKKEICIMHSSSQSETN